MGTHAYILCHHGIKGMKWGVRRSEAELARARGETPKVSSSKSKKTGGIFQKKAKSQKSTAQNASKSKPKSKNISEMSDDELRSMVNRLQLEKQYRDLSPKQVSKGKAFYDKYVAPALADTVRNVAKDYLNKQLRDVLGLKNDNYLDTLQKEVKQLTLEAQKEKLLEDRKKKK